MMKIEFSRIQGPFDPQSSPDPQAHLEQGKIGFDLCRTPKTKKKSGSAFGLAGS